MKNIKFSLFIILGLFIFNPLGGQEITSYSGAFHKISKYPSSSSGVSDSYYGHCRINVSNPENIGKVKVQYYYRYGTIVIHEEEFQFNTVDGKTFYEIDGISREVKHTGFVLDIDVTDTFIAGNWESSSHHMRVILNDKSGSYLYSTFISSCVFHSY